VEDNPMTKQGNEYLLDAEELKTLNAAEALLDIIRLSETHQSFRAHTAWKGIYNFLHPQTQGEDETEYARRIA
jgi:hypothetical protein